MFIYYLFLRCIYLSFAFFNCETIPCAKQWQWQAGYASCVYTFTMKEWLVFNKRCN